MAKFLFAAYAPGGARYLKAIANAVRARGDQVEFLGSGAARALWERDGEIVFENLDEVSVPDLMITGTGCGDYELGLWGKYKSLAMIDAWDNFPVRFTGADGQLRLPDAIGVIDYDCQATMQAFPWCSIPVFITGQPHLEWLVPKIMAERLKREKPSGRIVFFQNPLDTDFGRGEHGYDQFEIVNAIAGTLSDHELIIKPHPREDPERWCNKMVHPDVKVVDHDATELLISADGVLGMTTMVLLEAAFSGIPCLSFQIGRRSIFNPIIGRFVQVITEHKKIGGALQSFTQQFGRSETAIHKEMYIYSLGKCLDAIDALLGSELINL